jgi:hypothetical protein
MATAISAESATNNSTFLRFVECCTGTIILFRGSLPIVNGSVYSFTGSVPFAGSGGNLEPGRCYTITQEVTTNPVAYPGVPLFTTLSLAVSCGDEKCFNCNPANDCDCPEGYTSVDGICVGIETIPPIPPATIVFTGNNVDGGGGNGLLTFQSLNNFVWPLFSTPQLTGDTAAMTIIPASGNNPITGDSWMGLNPLPQTGPNLGKHQPILTATPPGFPAIPSPPNPPLTASLRPLRESTITGTTLNYGGGNPIGYDNYEPNAAPWNTWYTNVAVWTLPGLSVTNQYAGFLVCLEPTVPTAYQVIMSGNNGLRLFVDDYLAVEMLNGNNNSQALAYNNHFQITLSPGLHVLRLECYNYTGGGGLAAEVLECSAATVYGFTTLNDFIPYRKFSTFWKRSRTLTVTGSGNATIVLTSGTTLPTDISGFIVQTSGSGLPNNTFITSVINATTYTVNQNIPVGVYQVRLQFAYDVSSIASNSFSCPDGYTLTTCDGIACTKTLELPCKSNCYLIIPCDGTDTFVTNNFDFEDYINQFATVETKEFYGCAYITKLEDNDCDDAVEATVYSDEPCTCELRCFYVRNTNGFLYVDADDVLQEVSAADAKPYVKICSKIYPVAANNSVNYSITELGSCTTDGDEVKCPILCFTLTNCADETITINSNSDSLLPYALGTNNIVQIAGKEGCWKVSLSQGNCDCINVTFTGPDGSDTYTANSIGTFNGANLYQFTANNGDILYIWSVGGGWSISANGYGEDPAAVEIAVVKFVGDCPDSVNEGFTWIPSKGIEDTIETEVCPAECDCPIDLIVTTSYSSCEDCIGYIAYRLVSCTNNDVIYTLLNLEQYIGQVVKIDCGCYTVQQINYLPANPQLIKLEDVYTNCIECNRTYWKLTDCLEEANPIITYTDLGGYVGKTVKIKGCDECWNVESTTEHIGAISVLVTEEYIDCDDCGSNIPCQCSTITNYSEEVKTYTYLNCDKEYETVTLQPHETSDRICVLKWVPNRECCLESTFTSTVEKNIEVYNWQFETTDEIINGKPVYITYIVYVEDYSKYNAYKLSYQSDGCWYAVGVTQGGWSGDIPVYKLCTTSDCPVGVWERFDCGIICFRITSCDPKCFSLNYSFAFSYYDQNNNPVYITGLNYQLSYNTSLSRWEIIDLINNNQLIGYNPSNDNTCPSGGVIVKEWISVSENTTIEPVGCKVNRIDTSFETRGCEEKCDCINMNLYTINDPILQFILEPTGETFNTKPTYEATLANGEGTIYVYYNSNNSKWYAYFSEDDLVYLEIPFNSDYPDCPIGDWIAIDPFTPDNLPIYEKELNVDKAAAAPVELPYIKAQTEYCTTGTAETKEDPNNDPFAHIQFFGECQHGVCLPPVFKNNRTVRPGYNTPNCNPDRYDEITCKFADIMYKIVLEKRYGITNCCPEDDEKWLLLKELIDLQALKDPNYHCPDCPCSCNSGKSYSSCNCGN